MMKPDKINLIRMKTLMRTLLVSLVLVLMSGCGNMYFSPRTVTAFEETGSGALTFSTVTDLDQASGCLANEAVRYCATRMNSGVSIAYVPSDEPSNLRKSKATVTCTGSIDQKALDFSLNSAC